PAATRCRKSRRRPHSTVSANPSSSSNGTTTDDRPRRRHMAPLRTPRHERPQTRSELMSTNNWVPTDTQVRDGFRYDPEAEYRDPITPHHEINGRAFDRWLAKHDAGVAAKALRAAA